VVNQIWRDDVTMHCLALWADEAATYEDQRIWDLETPASFTGSVDGSSTQNDLITAKALWAID